MKSSNFQDSIIGRSQSGSHFRACRSGHDVRIGEVRAGGYVAASLTADGTVFRVVRASATLYAALPGI